MAIGLLEPAPHARIPVTVVIPTLNEARRLPAALESVEWADEIIVVDAGSSDDTVLVARRAGARVLVHSGGTIGAQRNAGIEAARNPWILALDADEEATPELRDSIAELCAGNRPPHEAFRVRSRNWHLGRELRHGPWGRDWKVRVFSRSARFSDARVHENLRSLDDVAALEGTLIHHPYSDLAHQVVKIAQYARWASEDMRAAGRRGRVRDMMFRPAWRFFRDYFIYSGWRDGRAGFIVTTVSAFSVFLKYATLLIAEL
jgi:glycosyltransferase involved in cell wall biosynthesis